MRKKTYEIEIRNLSYTYPDGTKALSGINISVESGESVAVLGPNGAGKSTLILALPGLIYGTGEIVISGTTLTKNSVRDIRRKVGIVFQNPDDQLFCPTVHDDVAFGPENMGLKNEEVDLRVKHALSSMGITDLEKRSAHHLSYGERKRASIATILSMDPEIIAFDEPTANLDPEGVHELKKVISGIKKTKLIVTHDINLALDLSSRAVVMNNGKIIEDMPTKKLASDKKYLKEMKLFFN
jgi:cobalt/nickel transport system ATP-binding protein